MDDVATRTRTSAAKLRGVLGLPDDATEEELAARLQELVEAERKLLEITEQDNVDDALDVAKKLVQDAPQVERETRRLRHRIERIKRRIGRMHRPVVRAAGRVIRVRRGPRRRRSASRRAAPSSDGSSDGPPDPPRYLGKTPRCASSSSLLDIPGAEVRQ